jgi:hypothetical protein
MSEISGTNGNFNDFSYFIYRLKLKVKRPKLALTLDEREETLHFGDSRRHRCILINPIFSSPQAENYRLLYSCRSQYVEQNQRKHGKAAE